MTVEASYVFDLIYKLIPHKNPIFQNVVRYLLLYPLGTHRYLLSGCIDVCSTYVLSKQNEWRYRRADAPRCAHFSTGSRSFELPTLKNAESPFFRPAPSDLLQKKADVASWLSKVPATPPIRATRSSSPLPPPSRGGYPCTGTTTTVSSSWPPVSCAPGEGRRNRGISASSSSCDSFSSMLTDTTWLSWSVRSSQELVGGGRTMGAGDSASSSRYGTHLTGFLPGNCEQISRYIFFSWVPDPYRIAGMKYADADWGKF